MIVTPSKRSAAATSENDAESTRERMTLLQAPRKQDSELCKDLQVTVDSILHTIV